MGTSKSSTGPGGNVPLIPDWLDVTPIGPRNPQLPQGKPDLGAQSPAPRIALPQRFNPARRAFGEFVKSGQQSSLKRGLGSYVSKGFRGSGATAARMGQAVTSANKVYQILSGLASQSLTPNELGFDPTLFAGADPDDVIDAIVDSVCRNDRSLDDSAGRIAANMALSEVLSTDDDMDSFSMPTEAIREVYLRTLAYHVFENVLHDIGVNIQGAADGDAELFNDRCVQIKEFILETFRFQLDDTETKGDPLDSDNQVSIANDVLSQVLDVFEGWIE